MLLRVKAISIVVCRQPPRPLSLRPSQDLLVCGIIVFKYVIVLFAFVILEGMSAQGRRRTSSVGLDGGRTLGRGLGMSFALLLALATMSVLSWDRIEVLVGNLKTGRGLSRMGSKRREREHTGSRTRYARNVIQQAKKNTLLRPALYDSWAMARISGGKLGTSREFCRIFFTSYSSCTCGEPGGSRISRRNVLPRSRAQ